MNENEVRDMSTEELIAKLKSGDGDARGDAWQNAGSAGAEAVRPLGKLAEDGDFEVARSATRALWRIVYHVGRPGADAEKAPVAGALLELLGENRPVAVLRDVLWMVSELAEGAPAVKAVAPLLSSAELREDARMALERIPGEDSLAALKKALGEVPEDFKIHVAQSLRARGVEVPGLPCRKLVPAKEKESKAAGG
jgi:HEAT repeat protein